MIIDKDAKVFGKINIIDLLLLIALVAGIVFLALRLRGGEGFIGPETRDFIISFHAEEVEDFIVNAISEGDTLVDNWRHVGLGTVAEINIDEAIIWNADQYGRTVRSGKEGFASVELSAYLQGTPHDQGIMIAGNRYGVGQRLPIRAGSSVIFMIISGLREVGE